MTWLSITALRRRDVLRTWLCILRGTCRRPRPLTIAHETDANCDRSFRGGPFSRRWAYFVAEIAGQAAIDVILGPEE
jgi:hypothetical protein